MNKKFCVFSIFMLVALILSACSSAATTAPSVTEQPVTTQPPPAPSSTSLPPTPTQPPPPTQTPVPSPTPAGPRVFKFVYTSGPTTWDPSASFSVESIFLCNMYEGLLRVNPPGSAEAYTPLLATSWEHSDDGLKWTFHLRTGVKFQDGADLNADAVIKSINRTINLGSGAGYIWAPVDKMEASDPMTVVFTLKYAAPMELIAGSVYAAWIISPKAIDAAANDPKYFEKGPGVDAGTGPYKLEAYVPEKEVDLTKFDGYWGGWNDAPHSDKVIIYIVPDEVTRQQMLFGGDVDQASLLPIETILRLKDDPNYTFYEVESSYNYLAYLNTLKPPLDNILVRQAISYAIPYDQILQAGYYGYGEQSHWIVPKGIWPYSDKVFQYTYDVEKAKSLMKQAGLDGKTFDLVLTYAAENPDETRFAPVIKEALAVIGLNVELQPLMWNQQWDLAKSDDPLKRQDIFVSMYWPTYSDAGVDNLYTMLHCEKGYVYWNMSGWCNSQFDSLISDASLLTVTDPAKSQEEYIQAMDLAANEAPMLAFYDKNFIWVTPKNIVGAPYNINYPGCVFFYTLYKK
jgi:peptide/nickel transport system substrate-binding protein